MSSRADGPTPAPAASSDAVSLRALTAACLLLAFVPALLTAFLVWRYAVDVPVLDQWSMVDDLEAAASGRWSVEDVMRSHNGHRIAVSRLILVPLALTTGWNTRFEVALSLVAAGGLVLVLAVGLAPAPLHRAVRQPIALLALAGSSLAVFSLAAWENWMWGIQLSAYLAALLAMAALFMLAASRLRWWPCALAAVLAVLASFSQGPGLVAWPAGLILLVVHPGPPRRRASLAVAWSLLMVALVLFYVQDLPGDAGSGSLSRDWIDHPLRALVFSLSVLGAPVSSFTGSAWPPQTSTVAPVAGALLLVVSGLLLAATWRRAASARESLFAGGALLFACGVAAQITLGRAQMGLPAAMASRYVTLVVVAWAVTIALAARVALSTGAHRVRRRAAAGWAVGAYVGLLVSSVASLPYFPSRQQLLVPAAEALKTGSPTELLARLHPEVEQVTAGSPVLSELGLSVFRMPEEQASARSRDALTSFQQRMTALDAPPAVVAGSRFVVPIEVVNESGESWPSSSDSRWPVNLSYHWLPEQDGELVIDGERTSLPRRLDAGESAVVEAAIEAPSLPGAYTLRLSMVQEGVAWFDEKGATPLDLAVEVEPGSPGPAAS